MIDRDTERIAKLLAEKTYPEIKIDCVEDDLILREYLDGYSWIIDEEISKLEIESKEYNSVWFSVFEKAFHMLKDLCGFKKEAEPNLDNQHQDLIPDAGEYQAFPSNSSEEKDVEEFASGYGMTTKIEKGEGVGQYTGRQITVGVGTEMGKAFAADWTGGKDFISSNEYPENIRTAAHEIAHGLFSKNPQKAHVALQELINIGVPKDVAFESLVDMGGLYLLEPNAIANPKIRSILDKQLTDFYNQAVSGDEIKKEESDNEDKSGETQFPGQSYEYLNVSPGATKYQYSKMKPK